MCVNVLEMCVWWYGIDDNTIALKDNINLFLSALFAVRYTSISVLKYATGLWLFR